MLKSTEPFMFTDISLSGKTKHHEMFDWFKVFPFGTKFQFQCTQANISAIISNDSFQVFSLPFRNGAILLSIPPMSCVAVPARAMAQNSHKNNMVAHMAQGFEIQIVFGVGCTGTRHGTQLP